MQENSNDNYGRIQDSNPECIQNPSPREVEAAPPEMDLETWLKSQPEGTTFKVRLPGEKWDENPTEPALSRDHSPRRR